MTVQNLLRSLRRGWWIVVAFVAVGGVIGGAASLLMTPMYEATSQVFVGFDTAPDATPAELVQANNFAIQKVYSYTQVVTSPRVLDQVIEELGLDESATSLSRDITVEVPTNSAIISITAQAPNPEDAVTLTAAVTDAFTATVIELETPTAGGTAPVRIESLEQPTASDTPASPDVLLNIALGLFVGLVVGLIAIGVLAATDRRIRRSDDVSDGLAVPIAPVVAGVPRSAGKRSLAILHDRPGSRAAEAYRTIAASIGHGARSMPRLLAVASCKPPESASAVTMNLALAFVEYGAKVVVVDANVRTGLISKEVDLANHPGLAQALAGRPLAELVVPRDDLGISILPSGEFAGNPASAFASSEFARVLRDLRGTYDLIVVDSAPVTPLSDALAIAGASDAMVLAMTAAKVTDADLDTAREALRSVGAEVVAAVVTDAKVSGPDADTTVASFRGLRA